MAEHGRAAQFVHRQSRKAATVVGQFTAGKRMLPQFLVVGAQRCGTTSVYKLLTQHPAVMAAGLHKGVHYFDTNYHRGEDWYRSHFPLCARAERLARNGKASVVTGEASPYYMFHPLAPQRIGADLPGVKVIAILRDPVERAYSAHAHELARGFEDEPFETAVALEPTRLEGEVERLIADPTYVSRAHQHNAYVSRGRYARQLEELERAVSRDRMLVVDFDDLFGDFAARFGEVTDFLEIPRWLPAQVEQRNTRPRTSMPTSVRNELMERLAEDDARLAKWWGHTPSWRR